MKFKPIDENTPQDKDILLRRHFNKVITPCIVVGEVITFKDKTHHLWKGCYEGVINVFKEYHPDWDEKFTHWSELE